jgi:predicted ATP-grasp superfamily ATP-dependent carboligase
MGGVSSLRESVEVDPEMLRHSIRILDELDWEGVAMVEFKIDSRDNTPKLMEINGRFWNSLQLAVSSGVDFPYLLFKTTMDEPIDPVTNYRKGIISRDLLNDFIHLFNVLFSRDDRFKYPGRISTFYNFLKFYRKNQVYDDISLSDPRLTMRTLADIISLPKRLFLKRRR